MADPQIQLKGVDIYYYTFDQGINSIKDLTVKFGFLKPFAKKKVLEDVNLDVYPGEIVGILGKNGEGKSSLLKCVSGILKSYTGSVSVHGRLAPMLALGSGIEMELTGIENIKLISSLLGNRGSDIQRKIEEVHSFSELSMENLKRQVKTYSTGMVARLSFSIAISEVPDILLIDEVLAVGDVGFQQKCIERILEFKEQGCTILFVSHGASDVRRICTRAICLNEGRVVYDGEVEEAINHYNQYFE
ncbi:MAG: ABC-type polysaccharide/polyol phosphate transport system ATPase subunit [Bacteroidia bacterium]|jgi:ABC-type polysaccharide/polyol phosphate transport system ATPase subunit